MKARTEKKLWTRHRVKRRKEWLRWRGHHTRRWTRAYQLNRPREMALMLGANSIYGKIASNHRVVYQDSDSIITETVKGGEP